MKRLASLGGARKELETPLRLGGYPRVQKGLQDKAGPRLFPRPQGGLSPS